MTDIKVNVNEKVDVSESVSTKVQKQKLTLGINKDVVDKAKEAGINISEITEQLLTTMTYQPKGNTRDEVMKAYQSFLDAMSSLLGKYGASIVIGVANYTSGPDEEPDNPRDLWTEHWTFYLGQGGMWKEGFQELEDGREAPIDSDGKVTLSEVISHMYDPKKILENLITALTTAAERNKEKLVQLDFAYRLVQTLKEENPRKKKK